MRKKVMGLVLVVTMVLASAMPVFAAENDQVENAVVDTEVTASENVSKVYDAYVSVQEALAFESLDELKVAVEGFYAVMDICNELTEEEWNEFAVLMDVEDGETAYYTVLSDWIDANIVFEVLTYMEAYESNPNVKTASEFVEYYDSCDEEYKALVGKFLVDVDAVYEVALADMPTENVQKVYTSFVKVQEAMESSFYEDLVEAVEAFYEVTDTFNELTEEEFAQLAVLLDVEDGEAAFNLVLSDWIDANVLVSAGEVYEAYMNDPSVENAKAFVEYIDSFDEMYEGDRSLLENFYFGISDSYEEAVELLASSEAEEAEGTAEETEDNSEVAPKTGDVSTVIPMMVLFASVAIVVAVQKKRMA